MVRAHSRWCGPARSICMQSMEPSQILSLKQLILWIITLRTRKAKIVRLLPCFFPSSRKMPAAPATGLKLLVGAGSLHGLSPHSPPDRAYSLVPWYVGGDIMVSSMHATTIIMCAWCTSWGARRSPVARCARDVCRGPCASVGSSVLRACSRLVLIGSCLLLI